MTTLANLIDRCEAQLDDPLNATWSAADVEQWCRDAIADYSLHFPNTRSEDLTTTTAQSYTVSQAVQEILSVEYPEGEDPPAFLQRYDLQELRVEEPSDGYAFEPNRTGTAGGTLHLGATPAAEETIRVRFIGAHDNTISTATAITIAPIHEHILVAFVLWKAHLQLLMDEQAAPTSNSSLLMAQLATNSDRARRAYVDLLAKAIFATNESGPIQWTDETHVQKTIY